MFTKHIINCSSNIFDELQNATIYEPVINGRSGAIIVKLSNENIPLVRTTTVYQNPAQEFKPIHDNIIQKIQNVAVVNNDNIQFNNALVEIYNNKYTKMAYHTDQTLDLSDNSYICLFTCYNTLNQMDKTNFRYLCIKNKKTNEETEILLEHNTAILFTTETNKKFLHKIICKNTNINNNCLDQKWLGITFRLSKTYIKFINELAYFANGNKQPLLTFATDDEKKLFYIYKNLENSEINYCYLPITFTISKSDLMKIQN